MPKMIQPEPVFDFNYEKELEELKAEWERYLKPRGVKWVSQAQECPMVVLYANLGRPVKQEQIQEYCQSRGLNYKLQLRHVADRGWAIGSGNARSERAQHLPYIPRDCMMLLTARDPNKAWLTRRDKERVTRSGYLNAKDWSEILLLFEGRGCAVCGTKCRHYDKGHLDPTRGYDIHNIVPMCVRCNNHAGAHGVGFELGDDLVARAVTANRLTEV